MPEYPCSTLVSPLSDDPTGASGAIQKRASGKRAGSVLTSRLVPTDGAIVAFAGPARVMCCDTRLRLIVIVLLYTGMRVGIEALRLKWADIDFEEAIITVAQSKTAAGLRALPMTAFVASELEKWQLAQAAYPSTSFSTRNGRVHTSAALRRLGTTF